MIVGPFVRQPVAAGQVAADPHQPRDGSPGEFAMPSDHAQSPRADHELQPSATRHGAAFGRKAAAARALITTGSLLQAVAGMGTHPFHRS